MADGFGFGGAADGHFRAMEQMRAFAALQRQASVGPAIAPALCEQTKVPAGSLIIADFFEASPPQDPNNIRPTEKFSHGEMVNMAARQNGFKGSVMTQVQPGATQRYTNQTKAEESFFDPKATPEQTRANLASFASNGALGLLESQTQVVNGAIASGAKNSALNLSVGGSTASLTERAYSSASMAWMKPDPKYSPEVNERARADGLVAATNFAEAYGLDVNKMTSKDPKVAGPERARLQEALMNGIDGSLAKNPEVRKAKQDFTTAVGRFESGRNSVVISSGNEGSIIGRMAKDSHGYKAKDIPKTFDTNFLDTPEATMVGATRWTNGSAGLKERVAGYSSNDSGVDIYASGSLSVSGKQVKDGEGTSFAAPRVAATMAELHKKHPNMTSAQIESFMRQSLTHPLNTSSGGTVSVLDYHKSSDFLVGRRQP
jgi:hypothetical protein